MRKTKSVWCLMIEKRKYFFKNSKQLLEIFCYLMRKYVKIWKDRKIKVEKCLYKKCEQLFLRFSGRGAEGPDGAAAIPVFPANFLDF